MNLFFELMRVRDAIANQGFPQDMVEELVAMAERDLRTAAARIEREAMQAAIEAGVQKRSPDFINDVRPSEDAFQLETDSHRTTYVEPEKPMLERLLKGAVKPMKDGSGVYRVIPVGGDGPKTPISTNIMDAQKAIEAQRMEDAVRQNRKKGNPRFRTATSRQNPATQWVLPEQQKDFGGELDSINQDMQRKLRDEVERIVREYTERV